MKLDRFRLDVKYEIYMGEGAINYWNIQLKVWEVVDSPLVFVKLRLEIML